MLNQSRLNQILITYKFEILNVKCKFEIENYNLQIKTLNMLNLQDKTKRWVSNDTFKFDFKNLNF